MNTLRVMDRYQKEVIQVSTKKNDLKVQYLYDNTYYMSRKGPEILTSNTNKCSYYANWVA